MNAPANAIPDDPVIAMRSVIQRIATGPELSKDISYDEARHAMSLVLDGRADPVQAAIFLIALRMKRETDDENRGVLQGIIDHTERVTAPVDVVVDLADPYDGYTRSLPVSAFLPATLAACGVAAVCHGVETVGPKYGVTFKQVLRAAGKPVDLAPTEAAARLADGAPGWTYIDQGAFCPPLHALIDLRTKIVKRPAITTVEVLAKPITGRRATHLVTGYVHKPYPRIYAMLARHAGFDGLLLVRGTEGGVIPSLRQSGKAWNYHNGGEEQASDFKPEDFGIEQELRVVPIPDDLPGATRVGDEIAITASAEAIAKVTVETGRAALSGQAGPARDALVAAGALVLQHLGRADSLRAAADQIRAVLDDGRALARFDA
ncbi:MAG: anthranilate phosphoribosyltransferase [Chromatiales bacterium]|nr:anthranilate phosphoribosyltransferase [Chromatiales bacterium]